MYRYFTTITVSYLLVYLKVDLLWWINLPFCYLKMKTCNKCIKEKKLKEFSKHKNSKDWLQYICKECHIIQNRKYNRSREWVITNIYSTQKLSSKRRLHKLPNYTKKELQVWVFSQDNFEELYNNWAESWYDRNLTPSIDRLDDYKGYSFDNIQLMTWRENKDKWDKDRLNWINNKISKRVVQIDEKSWNIINEFFSISEAKRKTNISDATISWCCRNNWINKTAWGYIWKFN